MLDKANDATPVTLPVNRAGRYFPSSYDRGTAPKSVPVYELRTRSVDESLPERIAAVIADRLAWNQIQSIPALSRESVAEHYIESVKQLDGYRNDVLTVLREACRANLEFRHEAGELHTEARDAVLERKLSEMMTQVSKGWKSTLNISSAELFSRPADEYCREIESSLSQECAKFAEQFLSQLAHLVDQQLIGLVEWLPNDCCRYHFFRQVVLQQGAESSIDPHDSWGRDVEDESNLRRLRGNRRETTTTTVKHQIRHARHLHELINAVRTSIRNSKVVMPPQIDRLTKSIPDWLYPFVEVIDGQIIRERIIERDVSVEDWTQVRVRDEPIVGIDPGIVIGPYVLSGWGTSEVHQVLNQRKEEARKIQSEFDERVTPWYLTAAVGLSGFAVWLVYQQMIGNVSGLFAPLIALLAISSLWRATNGYALKHQVAAATLYAQCMTVAGASSLLLLEWLVVRAFYPSPWGIPAVLGSIAAISYATGRLFR
jgi:hypothetical protein